MKAMFILLAFLALAFSAQAQLAGYGEVLVFNALTYANDDADTSATYTVGSVDKLSLRVYYTDSISVVYKFDYRVKANTAWTAVTAASADTVIDTGTAGYKQIVLRDNLLERIPGVSTQFRIRAAFAASANSANSGATHTGRLEHAR